MAIRSLSTLGQRFICLRSRCDRSRTVTQIQWVGIALPNHIEAAIRFARANGWKPDGDMILEVGADSNAEPVSFCTKPDGADRYWFYDDYYGEYSPRDLNNPNVLRRQAEADAENMG